MKLYIANQNYSSWSLRAWLIFDQYNLDVEVEKLTLMTQAFYDALGKEFPSGKVPALLDDDIAVWESLAILEYVNETYLDHKAWPKDRALRAKARALSAEMHAGFIHLRNEMPMNCRALRKVEITEGLAKDIARIDQIWSTQMLLFPNAWLFDDWSIADAMFAPVALRFKTYNVALSENAKQYQSKVLNSAAIQRWLDEASTETDVLDVNEAGVSLK
jgi:glutathione S-transferase